MPELPEIETIRMSLAPVLIGKTVQKITVYKKELRWTVDVGDLNTWVKNSRIVGVERRAKYLLFEMHNGATVVVHLGMSGRLGLFDENDTMEKHTHIVFDLTPTLQLRYRDPRRFGYIFVTPPGKLELHPRIKNLGVEPLSGRFHAEYVLSLSMSKRSVKSILMDAAVVAGVGNIYANEALFYAHIHPAKPVCELSCETCSNLVAAVKNVLNCAIASGGTTLNDFRNGRGEPGFFQLELAVYGRAGKPCQNCGAEILRVVQNQRSTFYCPECQK
ncbi:bifunctional DNA-formamidopyrimidine glycosylase/DNA-(apurinic or apyrimidinic site) lyase [candidate division KSB1 bacterium]|nr:bifunctional DNA-formamidopyrimidine glycosylase/DNA-(apurinic or apyrimidinic site) lyase [candidate division KSB1 bacterium]